ncbi:hypothetical protein BIY37_11940 [Candidatus Brocadia sapporoensis]|uniref:Uncharacterized protein n=1 Tax=Candidatus Brocadia sapporoensis TaxID=392547 RepID=A0A1V6LX45_9BACT|nr:hypothetical protein BIY37_11940 [Candidatus Brocadia sapporoensis]TVL95834.1 MAG: hypothetical protein CV082_09425 [Candidatus Brocadia sp. BL1]GJQ23117.1 MAG: hypothetical protein HBSAPP01_09070 [Candidatus Brocadia sapporoensis]
MKTFKKVLLLFGIGLTYIIMIYLTFHAVTNVYKTNNPIFAKKVVILTFFTNISMFAVSGYLIYKLKIPVEKK